MNNLVATALHEITQVGLAYCKFLAPNDTKQTGSHQAGFLISVEAGRLWLAPVSRGIADRCVVLHWHTAEESLTTESRLKYYASKREYRITQLGPRFPFRESHLAGSLFVCVPKEEASTFHVFLFQDAEAIDDVLAGLLLSPADLPTVWTRKRPHPDTLIAEFISSIDSVFPDTKTMAKVGRQLANILKPGLVRNTWDDQLLEWVRVEYQVFRAVERHFFLQEDPARWADVDQFLGTASSMMNRRKARAGKSLEHHIAALLDQAGIPFSPQAPTEGGHTADFLLPSADAYHSPYFPPNQLLFLAAKTTCKDRWRQILTETTRIPVKHLVTLQQALSGDQLRQMHQNDVQLIVPRSYHAGYAKVDEAQVWSVDDFVKMLQSRYR